MDEPEEYDKYMEETVAPLVAALNRIDGIVTTMSCGGHIEEKRLPFVTFTLDDPQKGLDNLALIHLAARSFGWLVCVDGIVQVNQESKRIPSLLRQTGEDGDKKKYIHSHFVLLPASAFRFTNNLVSSYLYFCDAANLVLDERTKIKKIAHFLTLHNRSDYAYRFLLDDNCTVKL